MVADGAAANIQMSNIAKIGGPRWKLLGSHGAITDGDGGFQVLSEVEGHPKEQQVSYHRRPGPTYYENIVAHLNDGTPLACDTGVGAPRHRYHGSGGKICQDTPSRDGPLRI